MILTSMHEGISRLATISRIILLFVMAHTVLALMMLFTFPVINKQLGSKAFDLRPSGYSFEEAYAMIQNLDRATINLYLFPQLFLLDILYPVLLALFLSAMIIRLSNLINVKDHSVFSNLFVLPFVAMIFDYLENILVALMITGNVDVTKTIVHVASFSTQCKGLFTTLSWIGILVLTFIWLKNKLKR